MEYKLVQQYLYIFVIAIHAVVSNRQNECQTLKTDSTTRHCPDNKCPAKYSDQCSSIMSMLVGIDKTNKGLQLQTQNQLSELENKIADIMHKIDPCSSSPCVNGKCSKFNDGFKCTCKVGFSGKTCTDTVAATDCLDLKQQEKDHTNGVYMLRLWRTKKNLEVYCDMNTDAGGWTVFQNRFNGDVDFYRDFKDYEDGFGDVYEEYWLGLKHIEELASQGTTELRLELTAADGSSWFETYSDFRLSLPPDYHFNLAGGINGTGNAHYRMMLYNGLAFTTRDKDSDLDTRNDLDTQEDLNCGKLDHSGWWFGFCMANHFANLNGEYCRPGGVSSYNSGYGGMMYKDFKGTECLRNFQNGIEGLSIEAPNYECGNDTQNENQIKDKGWIIESVRSSMKILCPDADVCSENQGDLVSPSDLCCTDCSCAEDCGLSENKTCCFQPDVMGESASILQRECIRVNHVGVGPSPSYYMVVACPNDFPYSSKEMESIAHSCENILMPVFSNTTKLIYKNRYCAQCHMVTHFTNWTSSLVCNRKGYVVYIPHTSLFPNCYIHFEYPGSLLDIQNSRCCSNIGTSEFVFPDNIPVKNLSRSDIISLCESDFYSPYLYKKHTIVRELYANIYCAMCNSFVPMYKLKPACKTTSSLFKDSKPFVSILDTHVVEDVMMKNRLPEVACRTMNSSSRECRQTRCPFGQMYNKAGKCEYITMRGDVKQFAVPLKLSPSPPFQDCSLGDIIDVNNIMSHLKSPWPKPWKIYKSFRQTSMCNCSDRMECLTYFGVVFEGPKTHAYFGEVMSFIESMISEDWYLATNGKAVRLMSAFLDLDAFNDRALWYLNNTTDDFNKHFVAPKFFPISKFDFCEQVPLEEDEYILKEPIEDKEIILYIKELNRILLPSEYMLHTRADGTVFPTVCLSDTLFRKVSKSTGDRLDYMEYIHAIALIVIVVVIDDIYNFIGCAYILSSF